MAYRHHPPPAPPTSRERLLADEVLYLHSLWRQGPPRPPRNRKPNPNPNPNPNLNPNPNPSASASEKTARRLRNRKRKRIQSRNAPPDSPPVSDNEWPVPDPQPPTPSENTWPVTDPPATQQPVSAPTAEATARAVASAAQRRGFAAAVDFFSKSESSEDEEDDDEDSDDEAFEFFIGIFEKDAALREYYEKNSEKGDFSCLACVGRNVRKGKARRFQSCVALVQHASTAARSGRRAAHRALAKAICRVLGWDVGRLPSIVLDTRDTLGQMLTKAVADVKEDNEEKDSSSHEIKQELPKEVAEKEDTKEIDLSSCQEVSKNEELPKEVAEDVDTHPCEEVLKGVEELPKEVVEEVNTHIDKAPSRQGKT